MEKADPLASLFEVAKAHRIPMSLICRRASIDPTTPSRWRRKKNGATLEKVAKLNCALADIIAEQASA